MVTFADGVTNIAVLVGINVALLEGVLPGMMLVFVTMLLGTNPGLAGIVGVAVVGGEGCNNGLANTPIAKPTRKTNTMIISTR